MANIFNTLISQLLSMLCKVLPFVLKFSFMCLAPFLTACIIYMVYYRIKGYKPIKSELGKYKEHNIIYKLFVELPRQIVVDFFTADPNIFKEFGLYLIIGKQGSGKSMTMAYLLRKWQTIYPKLKVISNMGYKYEDTKLTSLDQLELHTGNGIYGEVDVIDELQTVLGTEYSLKFPEYNKEILNQERKERRLLLCGTQQFDQVAKPIRLNCRYVFVPITLFGCFTIVRQYNCVLDKDGQLLMGEKNKPIKTFCFVHDEWLRTCYDSYKTIDKIVVPK